LIKIKVFGLNSRIGQLAWQLRAMYMHQRRNCSTPSKSMVKPKKIWEIEMTKKMGIIAASAAIVFLLANPEIAAAKSKKLSLEQAWALCKAEIDKTIPKADHSARYSAGGACLLRHGYRI
jgi:hypothetical protein